MTSPLTPVLSRTWDQDRSWTREVYEEHDGYAGLRTALAQTPEEVVQLVKDSELRGRGGAGFPTGMKWGFIPQGGDKPIYLVVNADESEPGTCKDIPLMMANPHELVEGVVIASYAIRAAHAFIYVRGEVVHVLRRLQAAVAEAYAAGYVGKDSSGRATTSSSPCTQAPVRTSAARRRRCSTPSRAGAASPGCGRRSPRSPASTRRPTVINNVESIASVPAIVRNGVDWFRSLGTETRPKLAPRASRSTRCPAT